LDAKNSSFAAFSSHRHAHTFFATNLRLDEATGRGSLCEFHRARRHKLKSDEWPVHGPMCEMAAKALFGAMQGMQGQVTIEEARCAFADAALEVRILVFAIQL
jgi:hypothetical protein